MSTSPAVRSPRSARRSARRSAQPTAPRRSRPYVLVDVENATGNPRFTSQEAAAVKVQLAQMGLITPDAQIAVGASFGASLVNAWIAWGGVRYGHEEGKDGADRWLLQTAEDERLAERFDHVVIVSGDGAFAPLARSLRKSGVHVTVVSRGRSLSEELRVAASTVRRLMVQPDLGLAA